MSFIHELDPFSLEIL